MGLPHEFSEMALTYYDLLYLVKKETAASMSVLTLHRHIIAPKHIFCLKTFL